MIRYGILHASLHAREELAWALLPLAIVGGSAQLIIGLGPAFLPVVLALHLTLAALLLAGLPGGGSRRELGPANRVTLVRATLVLPVTALVPWGHGLGTAGLWWVVGVGTLAMVLDGVDGRVARATGCATPLGARFDMELDALLLLALSVLVWRSGPLGPWVILIGLLRYLFVAVAWVWPALRGELPERFRRKAVCVVQGVALLVALGPVVPAALAFAAAAVALAALTWSFGVDVVWLARAARGGGSAPGGAATCAGAEAGAAP